MFRVLKLFLELGFGVVNMEVYLIWFMKVLFYYNFVLIFFFNCWDVLINLRGDGWFVYNLEY